MLTVANGGWRHLSATTVREVWENGNIVLMRCRRCEGRHVVSCEEVQVTALLGGLLQSADVAQADEFISCSCACHVLSDASGFEKEEWVRGSTRMCRRVWNQPNLYSRCKWGNIALCVVHRQIRRVQFIILFQPWASTDCVWRRYQSVIYSTLPECSAVLPSTCSVYLQLASQLTTVFISFLTVICHRMHHGRCTHTSKDLEQQ